MSSHIDVDLHIILGIEFNTVSRKRSKNITTDLGPQILKGKRDTFNYNVPIKD